MAVKGQKAKNVGVKKVKPAEKIKIPAFKQYDPTRQASVSESGVRNPGTVKGGKAIAGLYKANKTGTIPPNQVTKLKQIRANEASKARTKAFRKPGVSEAGIKASATKASPKSFRSTGERAPKTTFGKYRPVSPAPAATNPNIRDYARGHASLAASEQRNKSINDMRQNQIRKDSYRKQVAGLKRKKK